MDPVQSRLQIATEMAFSRDDAMKLKKSSSSQVLKSEHHQEYNSSPCNKNQEGMSN